MNRASPSRASRRLALKLSKQITVAGERAGSHLRAGAESIETAPARSPARLTRRVCGMEMIFTSHARSTPCHSSARLTSASLGQPAGPGRAATHSRAAGKFSPLLAADSLPRSQMTRPDDRPLGQRKRPACLMGIQNGQQTLPCAGPFLLVEWRLAARPLDDCVRERVGGGLWLAGGRARSRRPG